LWLLACGGGGGGSSGACFRGNPTMAFSFLLLLVAQFLLLVACTSIVNAQSSNATVSTNSSLSNRLSPNFFFSSFLVWIYLFQGQHLLFGICSGRDTSSNSGRRSSSRFYYCVLASCDDYLRRRRSESWSTFDDKKGGRFNAAATS
jgi:hypothetical protein